jgi:hypothetical protein
MVEEEKQGIIYLCTMRGYNQNLGMPPTENSHTAPKQLQNYFFWTSAQWNISLKAYSICHIAVNGIFPYPGMGRAEKRFQMGDIPYEMIPH